jgi:hypothetical protein
MNKVHIIDTMDISYKNEHIKNSIVAMSIVLDYFQKFCSLNDINCGNLYICKYEKLFVAYCDGLDNENETDDCSIEFDEYCENNNLYLDDRIYRRY